MNRRMANVARVISRHNGKALQILAAALAFLAANRLSWLFGLCKGDTTVDRLAILLAHMDTAFGTAIPSLYFPSVWYKTTVFQTVTLLVASCREKSYNRTEGGNDYGKLYKRWTYSI